jgi:CHAT domain-containing protein
MRLERQPLVILAACGTFRGDALHVAGMSSLSRAFLTAGARGVVGTLWEIEDDVSALLFLKLHRYLHAGSSPAHALRQAQTELLRSGDPRLAQPASWAAVEFLGSV